MLRGHVWADELYEGCPKCGGTREYTVWNTEKGYDEGWHCLECDTYFPNLEARSSNRTVKADE